MLQAGATANDTVGSSQLIQLAEGGPAPGAAVSLSGKKIHIPPMAYGSAKAFAAAFRAVGLEAEPTPPSDHRTRELGAHYTSGDECYPAKVTVGDFMKVLEVPGNDPARTVFFMPTAQGPCRFGQYSPYLRHVLDSSGYRDTQILAPSSNNGYGGLGDMARPFMRTGWRALLAADILQKMLLQYRRPHESRSGLAGTHLRSLPGRCLPRWNRHRSSRGTTCRHPGFLAARARPLPRQSPDAATVDSADRHRGRDFLPA